MYSSLYLVTPFLLVERFANQKRGPADPKICEAPLPLETEIASARTIVGAARDQNLAVRAADVEQPVGGVLDLQGRVVDAEPLVQDGFQLAPDPVAILAPADEHVGRKGREARADLPDME